MHTFKHACFAESVRMLADANRMNNPRLKALAMRWIGQDRRAMRRMGGQP
jgi:hypothetical protein